MREAVRTRLEAGMTVSRIASELGISQATVCYHARRLGYPPRLGRGTTGRRSRPSTTTATATARPRLGSGSRAGPGKAAGKIVARRNITELDTWLVAHSTVNRQHLKRRLVEAGLKQDRCEECGRTAGADAHHARAASPQRRGHRQPHREPRDPVPELPQPDRELRRAECEGASGLERTTRSMPRPRAPLGPLPCARGSAGGRRRGRPGGPTVAAPTRVPGRAVGRSSRTRGRSPRPVSRGSRPPPPRRRRTRSSPSRRGRTRRGDRRRTPRRRRACCAPATAPCSTATSKCSTSAADRRAARSPTRPRRPRRRYPARRSQAAGAGHAAALAQRQARRSREHHIWRHPRADRHAPALERHAALGDHSLDPRVPPDALEAADGVATVDLDAALLELPLDPAADLLAEHALEHYLLLHQDRARHAEPAQRESQLAADVAAAHEHDAPGRRASSRIASAFPRRAGSGCRRGRRRRPSAAGPRARRDQRASRTRPPPSRESLARARPRRASSPGRASAARRRCSSHH